MSQRLNVLFLEDSAEDVELCISELKRSGFDPFFTRVDNAEDFRAALARQQWDVVLADFSMPQYSALEGLQLLKTTGQMIPFVVVTGSINEETAVCCLKQGADDYILKNNMTRLGPAVQQAIRVYKERQERQALEEQLRRAQKMEAIGQLSGGIAHDFNNILTAILGNAEMALEALESIAPQADAIREGLLEIEKSAERAAALTRQLLAFSRRQVIQPVRVDLNRMLRDMEKMLKRLIAENIRLEVVTQAGLRLVKADPGQLEQVVMNLAVNARDAMPKGGLLRLETANEILDKDYLSTHPEARGGPHVRLTVRDTGCGMDRQTLERAFEPFFTTKEVGQGTGLGLATVYGIVKQAEGHITVESGVGSGTTFYIYLPVCDEDETEGPVGLEGDQALEGKETILICEDDVCVRELAMQMLQAAGYQILAAENGEQALRLAQASRKPIDLLITDVIMPVMDGKELSKRMKKIYPEVRTLFVSGYTAEIIARHGVLQAGLCFLEKPFTSIMLLRKVRESLDAPTTVVR